MDVAHRVGHHVGGDFAPDVGERLRMAEERRFESRKDAAPGICRQTGRSRTSRRYGNGVVEDQARDRKRLVPILRIKAFGASLRFGAWPIASGHADGNCADGVDRDSASSSSLISASMPSKSGVVR